MTISLACPRCRQSYRLQDQHAGKKFRCKNCETVIHVPYEDVEVLEEDDWGDDEPWNSPLESSLPRKRSTGRSRSRRSRGRTARRLAGSPDAMPTPLRVVLGILGFLIFGNVVRLFGMMLWGNPGNAIGVGIGVAIMTVFFIGLSMRSNLTRKIFIGLCVLLVLLFSFGLTVFLTVRGKQNPDEVLVAIITMFIALSLVLTSAILVSRPSVQDYFEQ